MLLEKKDFNYWNCLKRPKDITDKARQYDKVYVYGDYVFCLQMPINNFCIMKKSNKGTNVIEAVRSVLEELYTSGHDVIIVMTGKVHRNYDILYRYFKAENITKTPLFGGYEYIVYLGDEEWRK